jgi:hypothetical protein
MGSVQKIVEQYQKSRGQRGGGAPGKGKKKGRR